MAKNTGRDITSTARAAGGSTSSAARHAEQQAQRATQHPSYRGLARAGLTARAIVYFFLGGITLEIAVRHSAPARDDSDGAFSVIARQPGGKAMLAVLALGLVAYGVWRVVQAAGDPGGRKSKPLKRLCYLASGIVYFGMCAEATRLIAGSGSGGASQHPQPFVASVLKIAGGPELVGLLGVAIAVGGVTLAVWGAVHSYAKVLHEEAMTREMRLLARATGTAGDVARGAAVVLVGAYLVSSAVTNDPHKAKALGDAMQSVVAFTTGPELLGLLGAGLVCFGVYSLIEVRYRRLGNEGSAAASKQGRLAPRPVPAAEADRAQGGSGRSRSRRPQPPGESDGIAFG